MDGKLERRGVDEGLGPWQQAAKVGRGMLTVQGHPGQTLGRRWHVATGEPLENGMMATGREMEGDWNGTGTEAWR